MPHGTSRRKRSKKRKSDSLFRRRYGVGKTLLKKRTRNEQLKYQEKSTNPATSDRGTVPVTPQMIRLAVKELHTKRVFVNSTLIADYLRRCYPIEGDPASLKKELGDKLKIAVCVGLIAKCGCDAYCLPTLRQQATNRKTDFTAFWERYNKSGPRTRRDNCLENPRSKLKGSLKRDLSDYSDNNDDDDIP